MHNVLVNSLLSYLILSQRMRTFALQYTWKRPHEISPEAKLFLGGATAFDVKQGGVGDCWFMAAMAILTSSDSKKLVERLFVKTKYFDKV
jgi:hypothetical protein